MSPSLEQRRRSDSSFERLYRRHRRDVYGAVLRDVRDPDEAEDVTQTAFLNAYRAIRRGEEPDKPRAWLVTIARNVIRRRYRTLASRPQEVRLDPELTAADTDADGPTAGEIAATIRRLPDNQRAVILLREIQGRSYMEIATQLGLSVAAVETLIFRARRSLSELLEADEHVPATQKRRARAFFFLPLPGLGKLGSLGFSCSRTGVAALVGGVAIVASPLGDRVQRAPPRSVPGPTPSLVEQAGIRAASVDAGPATSPSKAPVRRTSTKPGGGKSEPALDQMQSTVDAGATPAVPLPSVPTTDTGGLSLPPLPVQPPPLPSPPPLPLPLPPPPSLG